MYNSALFILAELIEYCHPIMHVTRVTHEAISMPTQTPKVIYTYKYYSQLRNNNGIGGNKDEEKL